MSEYEISPGGVLQPTPVEAKRWRAAKPGSQLARLRERVENDHFVGPGDHAVLVVPDDVIQMIKEFEQLYDDTLTNHFAHISLHDYNLECNWLASDIQLCTRWLRGERDPDFKFSIGEVIDLADFLAALCELDDDERELPDQDWQQ